MATREVLFSVCDRCHAEVETAMEKPRRGVEFMLPVGWLHIAANTRTTTAFELDLCGSCKKIVLEAAGLGDTSL